MRHIERLRVAMSERDYDLVRIQDPLDMYYLIGVVCSGATLFVSSSKCVLLTDYRYYYEALARCPGVDVIDMGKEGHPFAVYGRFAKEMSQGVLAYDGRQMLEGQLEPMRGLTPHMKWINFGSLISDLRSVKTPDEVAYIRQACEITDHAFAHIVEWIRPGMTEKQVALEVEYSMKKNGADLSMAYDIVVASGVRSSYAHGRATDKVIEENDTVLFDFGCKFQGYCSDLSRTIFMGKATDTQREVYETVQEAQVQAIKALAVGRFSAEIEKAARAVCVERGHGDFYGTGLGHGVGLSVAEAPMLIDVPGFFPSAPLKAGQVMTIEPAIYIPNTFGVRIEDIVLLRDDGIENLVRADKALIELNFA